MLLPKQALYQAEPRPGPRFARVVAAIGGRGKRANREQLRGLRKICDTIQSHRPAGFRFRSRPLGPAAWAWAHVLGFLGGWALILGGLRLAGVL